MVKDWSKLNPKWNPYRIKMLRPPLIASAFLEVGIGIVAWNGGYYAASAIALAAVLSSMLLLILSVVFPAKQESLEQLQTLLPQERELAVFKNVRAVSGNYSFIADLHLTERRIFVTPNDQTKKRFLMVANRLSADLAQVIRISFHRRSRRFGNSVLFIGWKTGSHFWNRVWVAFQLSDETFEQARSMFPSIISLAEKVKV